MTTDHSERFTIGSARRAVETGDAGVWVRDFLASDGSDNEVLGRQLHEERVSWWGPSLVGFDELHRLAGPPDQPTLERLDDDDLATVDEMHDELEDGWSPPPLIATFRDDHLVVEDGNHRIEGLRRAGHRHYWTLIGFETDSARSSFIERAARRLSER